MVLTLDQWDLSPTSSPPSLMGRYGSQGPPGPAGASGAPGCPGSRDWAPSFLPSSSSSAAAASSHPPHLSSQSPSPSPSQTPTPSPSNGPSNPSHGSPSGVQTSSCAPTNLQPQGHRLGSKPSSLGLVGGPDRRNGSPSSGKAASGQQQPVTGVNSLSNNSGNGSNNGSGAALSTAALQAHQHTNRTNGGVTLYPYQVRSCSHENAANVTKETGVWSYIKCCSVIMCSTLTYRFLSSPQLVQSLYIPLLHSPPAKCVTVCVHVHMSVCVPSKISREGCKAKIAKFSLIIAAFKLIFLL